MFKTGWISTFTKPRLRTVRALRGEQLQVLNVDDRRFHTQEPVHDTLPIVADEERRTATFHKGVDPARESQRIVDMLHRLDARDQAITPRLKMFGTEDFLPDQAPDVVSRRRNWCRGRLDTLDIRETGGEKLAEKCPVTGANVDRAITIGQVTHERRQEPAVRPTREARLCSAIKIGVAIRAGEQLRVWVPGAYRQI